MMLSGAQPLKIELSAYITLILGILGDHFSTKIGLNKECVIEVNPMAFNLMQQGIWVQTDILLIIINIVVIFISLRIMNNRISRMTLLLPFLIGLFRLSVAIWNISLMR